MGVGHALRQKGGMFVREQSVIVVCPPEKRPLIIKRVGFGGKTALGYKALERLAATTTSVATNSNSGCRR